MTQPQTTENNSLSLAAAAEVVPQAQVGLQYLLVALAGREYGVRLDVLQEVLRFNADAVAPVPNTPDWLDGIISLRGTIISVVNLRVFLGFSRYDETAGRGLVFDLGFRLGGPIPRLLVVYIGDLQVGLLVDDILGVVFVNIEALQPIEDEHDLAAPYLEGIYHDPNSGKSIALLAARQLITSSKMLQFEPPEN